jgi:hypothetical protein
LLAHDDLKQTITSNYRGYTKPLHLQDHKNESLILIRCMQITKDHNNAKNFFFFLCPFSIDSWWKSSMVIFFQVETKNNKEKTWCTKKTWWTKEVHDQAKNAYIPSSPSWTFLKILWGGITYKLHWSALLRLMFLQPTLLCINALGNTPFHNHIQATLTSKVAFSKIMEYWILLQKALPSKETK